MEVLGILPDYAEEKIAEKQQLRILQKLNCEIRLFPAPIQIVILYLGPSSNISILIVYIPWILEMSKVN